MKKRDSEFATTVPARVKLGFPKILVNWARMPALSNLPEITNSADFQDLSPNNE